MLVCPVQKGLRSLSRTQPSGRRDSHLWAKGGRSPWRSKRSSFCHGARHGIFDTVEAGAASLVGEDGAQEELHHAAEQVRVTHDEQADVVG